MKSDFLTAGNLLRLLFQICGESDRPVLGRLWWRWHELADGGEDDAEGLIVCDEFLDAGFELLKAAGQLSIRGQQLPQFYESTYDVDTHLDGARRVQDIGGLDGTVLGEDPRQFAAASVTGRAGPCVRGRPESTE